MIDGLMMDFPLTLTHFLRRARDFFGHHEIVSRKGDKSLTRISYADFYKRCAKLAHALRRLGVTRGDRVATLAWNHSGHLEAYLGVPCMGAVVHTLNLRLSPDELGYIAAHAEDKVLLVDASLLPLFEKFREKVPSIRHVLVFDADPSKPLPDYATSYEALLAPEVDDYDFPHLGENESCMLCYTSGTTGNPKGVLYSHRSTVLHALGACMRDNLGIACTDTVLPVVPMFHAAAWGLTFASVATGAKLVMPGPHLDPTSLLDLMAAERVTFAGGVPTIWIGILDLLDKDPKRFDLGAMRTMVIGGSAAPPALIEGFRARHGLEVTHAWGMTETSPLGTVARLKPELQDRSDAEKLALRASQGFATVLVEQRHTSEDGTVLPWDGKSMGELEVRGPWVARAYYGGEGKDRFTKDGWFRTGDVVTIDVEGYVNITDRSKDVVKSGGEWISSVALENALMAHPAVLEAAVFAAAHPKWSERPVAAIVEREGKTVTDAELATFLESKFPKYWLPDAYVRVAQVPRTSTGKFMKSKLRDQYGDVLTKK
jgi:fatty-acyl-CoA synthase